MNHLSNSLKALPILHHPNHLLGAALVLILLTSLVALPKHGQYTLHQRLSTSYPIRRGKLSEATQQLEELT
jgi:hypothetical protein